MSSTFNDAQAQPLEQNRRVMNSARYRLRQFFRGLAATLQPTIHPEEVELVRRVLTTEAFSLFGSLPRDAQRHSLNVLNSLAEHGTVADDLAAAALLHDVGKLAAQRAGIALGLWLRGPLVLAELAAPAILARAARNDPQSGWRYLVWVHFEHGAIGAEWAAAAGCSKRTCWLIAHHDGDVDSLTQVQADKQTHPLPDAALLSDLRRLQQADNLN